MPLYDVAGNAGYGGCWRNNGQRGQMVLAKRRVTAGKGANGARETAGYGGQRGEWC